MEYDVNGFLEKNRDTVSKELVNVIRQSEMSLCKQLMDMEEIDTLSADAMKTQTLGGRVVISAAKKQVKLLCTIVILLQIYGKSLNYISFIFDVFMDFLMIENVIRAPQ